MDYKQLEEQRQVSALKAITDIVGFVLVVAAIAAAFAFCVWLVASITPASLETRWRCTQIAFAGAFFAFLFVLSLCWISGRDSRAEERREGQ